MDKEMKINTVNVIESVDGGIVGLTAFQDTPEGNKEAEAHFKKICIEQRGGFDEDWLEDGLCELSNWNVVIFHST
jgi:hypothetical protein